ncbi:MAG: hypothetical protein JSV75_03705 [Candidatus Bathyarchaeota archaeon]|nr:MAG: hypothetical protein JSV75_03705 [Candidatus Bathyarchaeota archaeon]
MLATERAHARNPMFQSLRGVLGLSLIALGTITLAWVVQLTLFDMITWGKDITLIFFSSRIAEHMFPTLGIDMRIIHYFLVGLILLLTGLVTFHARPKRSKCPHPFGYLVNLPDYADIPQECLFCEYITCIEITRQK